MRESQKIESRWLADTTFPGIVAQHTAQSVIRPARPNNILGVSGVSSDMRCPREAASASADARLAIEIFCYSVRKQIAAMISELGGIDLIVFTGGIGEMMLKHATCSTNTRNYSACRERSAIGNFEVPFRILNELLNRAGRRMQPDPGVPDRKWRALRLSFLHTRDDLAQLAQPQHRTRDRRAV